MSERCGLKWDAPYLRPDGSRTTLRQECVLFKDHAGDHRSLTNVVKRRGRDSDPGTQLCWLPPNHSATAPESRG